MRRNDALPVQHAQGVMEQSMATVRYRLSEQPNPLVPNKRIFYWLQDGWNGDKRSSFPYYSVRERVRGNCRNPLTGVYTAYDAGNSPGQFTFPSGKSQYAYNKAYGSLQGKLRGATAQLGATLGEMGQSSKMVRERAIALWRFTRRKEKTWLRRRSRSKKFRERYKQFSDYWLEYSFGWAPLFGDLYNGMKALSSGIQDRRAYAGAREEHQLTTGGGNPRHQISQRLTLVVYATLRITNPNVYLLQNLGLTNPAAVAWELARWSFVADWLFDIGSWINSWDDGFGVEYLNSGVSWRQFSVSTQTWADLTGSSTSGSLVSIRTNGLPLPLPNLCVLKNIGGSLSRAANALALVGQIVGRRR